jgi:hypothetical protein
MTRLLTRTRVRVEPVLVGVAVELALLNDHYFPVVGVDCQPQLLGALMVFTPCPQPAHAVFPVTVSDLLFSTGCWLCGDPSCSSD